MPLLTPHEFNRRSEGNLPALLGIKVLHVGDGELRAELALRQALMASNGYMHAASVVALADTSAGYGCVANLPEGATGFTTVELKSNHLGTARDGVIECIAKVAHRGRTTQVWDSIVTHRDTGRTIALFRCTQMILYPKATG